MIFVFLAYDELFQVHESFTVDLRERFSLGGLLYFSWIIPYGIGTIVIGLLFFRFLVSLPGRSARLFIVSGVIYMTGAVGLEMLGGLICSSGNCMSVAYTMVTTVEELLELLGIAIFIYALLSYTAANKCSFRVVIRE